MPNAMGATKKKTKKPNTSDTIRIVLERSMPACLATKATTLSSMVLSLLVV
jgi:hypothetical protein